MTVRITKVLKYFFKPANKPWNDPSTYSVEEKQLHDDYVAYVNSQEGYDGNLTKTHIDENTLKHTYYIANEPYARNFAFNIHDESNPVVNSYITMMRNKSQANNATDYEIRCAIEYSNGEVVIVK
jgi:hypothetical protein